MEILIKGKIILSASISLQILGITALGKMTFRSEHTRQRDVQFLTKVCCHTYTWRDSLKCYIYWQKSFRPEDCCARIS